MPRKAAFTTDDLTHRALQQFWQHGYHATSMDDLVRSTGVSRHGIYSSFGGKKELFLACFGTYQDTVVSPAFAKVEAPGATLDAVAAYFEFQIARGEAAGLPGPGCFVANSATEVAPSDAATLTKVTKHNDRLRRGFRNAIAHQSTGNTATCQVDVEALADMCVVFTNGLWSMSRTVTDAAPLRRAVDTFLSILKAPTT